MIKLTPHNFHPQFLIIFEEINDIDVITPLAEESHDRIPQLWKTLGLAFFKVNTVVAPYDRFFALQFARFKVMKNIARLD